MGKKIKAFGDIEIRKRKFHHRKNSIQLKDADTEKVQVSNMVSSGEKNYEYFIGYKDDDNRIKPLRIMFPKPSAYGEIYYGETK